MLHTLQSADFFLLLNETFRIRLEGVEPIELELVNIAATGSASRSNTRQPFALTFLGPVSQQYLVQHIYCLEHESIGKLDLFIVPLGPDAGRMRYEAIFS